MTATYYPDVPYEITTAGLDYLTSNDDDVIEVDLGFKVTVGETSGSIAYLSNNGFIAFGDGAHPEYGLQITGAYSGAFTQNWVPVDLTTLALPVFAGLWYDVDTRDTGTTRYGYITVGGQKAFRAVWSTVGAYDRQPYYSTFAMTVYDAGSDSYYMESHVSINDAYQWTEPTQYPSPTVTIGLALGVSGVTPANIYSIDLTSRTGSIDDQQWRGRANTNPGLYVFESDETDGWGVRL